MNITGIDGRPFEIRIIREGDKYGRDNCLTHEDPRPMVEFWDMKHNQFVSRYYVDTLLGRDGYVRGHGALNLDGREPVWTIDAVQMAKVRSELETIPPTETYEEAFEGVCPQCEGVTDGFGVFATGVKIITKDPDTGEVLSEYQPMPFELLKSIAQDCDSCGWNQHS